MNWWQIIGSFVLAGVVAAIFWDERTRARWWSDLRLGRGATETCKHRRYGECMGPKKDCAFA